jgi:hypothetical protein
MKERYGYDYSVTGLVRRRPKSTKREHSLPIDYGEQIVFRDSFDECKPRELTEYEKKKFRKHRRRQREEKKR